MKIEYIHVNVRNSKNPDLDFIQLTGHEIVIEKETYLVSEYTYQRKICSIGIQFDQKISKASLATKQNGTFKYIRPLYYSQEFDYWYDRGLYEQEGTHNNVIDAPLGMNQCGTYYIVGLNGQDNIIEISQPIQVVPSLITNEEFQVMLDEISIIGDWLLHQSALEKNFDQDEWEILQANETTELLEELSRLLNAIDKNPAEKLQLKRKRVPYRQVKRMDSRLLIEREMFPFQESVNTPITDISYNIYEHRAIRGTLELLHEKWNGQLNITNQKLSNLRNSLADLPIHINVSRQPINEEQRFIAEQTPINIAAKRNTLEKSIKVYESNKSNWMTAIKKVEHLLELKFLRDLPFTEELNPSHLFEMDTFYAEVYEQLIRLLQHSNEPWVINFQDSLKKTPDLYETWCFLKICSLLIKEAGFVPIENLMIKIQEHVHTYTKERSSLLSGIFFTFERPIYSFLKRDNEYKNVRDNMKLTVYYDEYVQDKDGELLRPDIRLVFSVGASWSKTVYLDMKYKPNDYIEREIQNVAFQKYYIRMNRDALASFIIHPNNYEPNWSWSNPNIANNAHTFGAFCLRPEATRQWDTFLTMLFHYRFRLWTTCCSCGSHNKSEYQIELTGGGYEKFYITCMNPDCRQFYVRSHCYRCHKHLCKYPPHSSLNYHNVQGQAWYVSCPNGCDG
jgi:predicted nucleic-acid-binding Zn-ribbon protein